MYRFRLCRKDLTRDGFNMECPILAKAMSESAKPVKLFHSFKHNKVSKITPFIRYGKMRYIEEWLGILSGLYGSSIRMFSFVITVFRNMTVGGLLLQS
jgi:hypothetical protein